MMQENLDPAWTGEATEEGMIYREHILVHYKHPHNFGRVLQPTALQREVNPVCGDDIEISLKIKKNIIEDIKFQGKGCAISIAAASLLTDDLKGKQRNDAQNIDTQRMQQLLGVKLGPVRLRCGTLALHALHAALGEHHE